jgi:hypothetical protein
MSELTPQQERIVEDFNFELAMIDGPEDMFPPDDLGGDREPRWPKPPRDSGDVALAAVYDLTYSRRLRNRLQGKGAALLHDIELILA